MLIGTALNWLIMVVKNHSASSGDQTPFSSWPPEPAARQGCVTARLVTAVPERAPASHRPADRDTAPGPRTSWQPVPIDNLLSLLLPLFEKRRVFASPGVHKWHMQHAFCLGAMRLPLAGRARVMFSLLFKRCHCHTSPWHSRETFPWERPPLPVLCTGLTEQPAPEVWGGPG